MLVQERQTALRLVRQHDHALLAGQLAAAWALGGNRTRWITVLATAWHDVVWQEEDRAPRLDPRSGRPHDFTTLPAERKRAFVEEGMARLEALDPAVATLVAQHHRALAGSPAQDPAPDLPWLRFFDDFSLFICLSPPGSLAEGRPPWLGPERLRPPHGGALSVTWEGEDTLLVQPYPFATAPLQLLIPYRDLPRRGYSGQRDLQEAWEAAPERSWALSLVG